MIDTILFDLDNTLLDFSKAERIALRHTLQQLHIPPCERTLARYSQLNQQQWELLEQGKITREQVKVRRYRLLFEELGVDCSAEQVPVILLLFLIPVHGTAAPEILHLDGMILIAGHNNRIAVPLPRLIDGVGQDFKHRVLAALQAVRAENHRRALPDPVGALERGNAVVSVGLLFFHLDSSSIFCD